jgi:hypothetical protein
MDAAKIKSFNLPAAVLRADGASGHGAQSRPDGAEVAAVVAAAAAFDTLLAEAGTGETPASLLPEPLPRNGVIVNLSARSTGLPPEAHALAAALGYAHLKPDASAAAQAVYARPTPSSETPGARDENRRGAAAAFAQVTETGPPARNASSGNIAASADPLRPESQQPPAPFAAALHAVMPPIAGVPAKVEDTPVERARVAERLAAVTPPVEGVSAPPRVPFGKLLLAAVAIAAVLLVLLAA